MSSDTNLSNAIQHLFETTNERISGLVSAIMISSPLWLQHIKPYSDIASLIAPILGCIYLSLQIGFKLWDRSRNDE